MLFTLKSFCIILLFLFIQGAKLFSQVDTGKTKYDTSNVNYTDLSQLFALKVYTLLKLNSLEISNEDNVLLLRPNSPLSLGVGFNYKGIGLSLGFGLPHSAANIEKYGKTSRFDVQASISMKRIGGDAWFQLYKGYYLANPNDFVDWDKDYYPQFPDMRTISFGASAYYIVNHDRFSNKAAYSRTQIQRTSAGSLTPGFFFNYDETDLGNDSTVSNLPDSLFSGFDIKSFRYFATGFSIGYTYTWVISEKFFLNGVIIPGFGYKDIKIKTAAGESEVERKAHAQLLLRAAFGYENKHFYAGLTASTLIRNIETDNYNINLATEQLRLFVGKRFGF